jgi:hypothetical protein
MSEHRTSESLAARLREAHEGNYGTMAGQPILLEAADKLEKQQRALRREKAKVKRSRKVAHA